MMKGFCASFFLVSLFLTGCLEEEPSQSRKSSPVAESHEVPATDYRITEQELPPPEEGQATLAALDIKAAEGSMWLRMAAFDVKSNKPVTKGEFMLMVDGEVIARENAGLMGSGPLIFNQRFSGDRTQLLLERGAHRLTLLYKGIHRGWLQADHVGVKTSAGLKQDKMKFPRVELK